MQSLLPQRLEVVYDNDSKNVANLGFIPDRKGKLGSRKFEETNTITPRVNEVDVIQCGLWI